MRRLDRIFRKRLERIREELNSYIDSHLSMSENNILVPSRKAASEEKRGGVSPKFLNYMKLNDETYDDWDDFDGADDSLSSSEQGADSAVREASGLSRVDILPDSRLEVQSKPFVLPDFLKKDIEKTKLEEVLAKRKESFSQMLLRIIDEKGLRDSDVYKRANIDRRLFSKIRGDEEYIPSKKTAISFCLALQLDLDAANTLLATAGYTLSASSRFDLIIMYLIENCEYNIHFVNIVLDDYGEGTLSR